MFDALFYKNIIEMNNSDIIKLYQFQQQNSQNYFGVVKWLRPIQFENSTKE
ncbi:MAG: hypothetical protein RL065_1516 [Bacteroidota bacterium]|jgi:hypothetical protein